MKKKVFVNFKGALYKRTDGPAYSEAYEKRRLKYYVDEEYRQQMIEEGEIVFSEGGEAFVQGAATAFGYDGFLIAISAVSDGGKKFEQSIKSTDEQGEKELIAAFVSFCKDDCGLSTADEIWYTCDDNDFIDLYGHEIADDENKLIFATYRISMIYLAKLSEAFPALYKDIDRIIEMQTLHIKGCEGHFKTPFEKCMDVLGYGNLSYRPTGEYSREVHEIYRSLVKKDKYSDEELNIIINNWCPSGDDENDGDFATGLFHDRTTFLVRSRIAFLRLFRDKRDSFDSTIRFLINSHVADGRRFDIKSYLDFLGGRPCMPHSSSKSHFFADECWEYRLMPADFYTLAHDDLDDFDSPELQTAIDGYHALLNTL